MPIGIEIAKVELLVSRTIQDELDHFYTQQLKLGCRAGESTPARYAVGGCDLTFRAAGDDRAPFYHFAFLAPGDRFAQARVWLSAAAPLLPDAGGETTFDFDCWDAQAAYVLDPAQNIVEIIAHRGLAESGARGPFDPDELRGLSELGLVAPRPLQAVRALTRAGLPLWSGAAGEGHVAFCGEQARTMIVCPVGRCWLPTDRPAEIHPLRAEIRDPERRVREVRLTAEGDVLVR